MGRRALLAYPCFSRNQLLNYENSVAPNTHHLVTWGRTLREDHARGLRSERAPLAARAAMLRGSSPVSAATRSPPG